MANEAVSFVKVSKRFQMRASRSAFAWVRDRLRRHDGARSAAEGAFWALRDLGFSVSRGEAFGVIGSNGAGKSTVLKLLAGILRPDAGVIRVAGRVAALIEVGAGFHGDLSGRENIFLNGCILGMSRSEIRRKLDAIVAFAGLERFLDMPVKRYSSGMYARLGFSVAAHTEPDVLLVDEVLSVGDAVFRVRCLERMRELVRSGTALVFVTHDLEQMRSTCARALVLDQGRAVFMGSSDGAVTHHLRAMTSVAGRSPDIVAARTPVNASSGLIRDVSLHFLGADGDSAGVVSAAQPAGVEVRFGLRNAVNHLVVELNARTTQGVQLLSLNTARSGWSRSFTPGPQAVRVTLAELPLAGGEYFWNVRMWDADRGTALMDTPFCFPMVLRNDANASGAVCIAHRWSITAEPACVASTMPGRLATRPNANTSGSGALDVPDEVLAGSVEPSACAV